MTGYQSGRLGRTLHFPRALVLFCSTVLDSSHVPFTHHKSMSNRNALGAYDIELLENVGPGGFSGNWRTGPRGGKLGPQSTEFRPPGYMKHKLQVRNYGG